MLMNNAINPLGSERKRDGLVIQIIMKLVVEAFYILERRNDLLQIVVLNS